MENSQGVGVTFRDELKSIGALTSIEVAHELDRRDPLAPLRAEFSLPKLRAVTSASGENGDRALI